MSVYAYAVNETIPTVTAVPLAEATVLSDADLIPVDIQEKYFMNLTDEKRDELIHHSLLKVQSLVDTIVEKCREEVYDITFLAEQSFLGSLKHHESEKIEWIIYGKHFPKLIQFLAETYKLVPLDGLLELVEREFRKKSFVDVHSIFHEINMYLKLNYQQLIFAARRRVSIAPSLDAIIEKNDIEEAYWSIDLHMIVDHFIYQDNMESIFQGISDAYPTLLNPIPLRSKYLNLCKKNHGHHFKYKITEIAKELAKNSSPDRQTELLAQINSIDFSEFFDTYIDEHFTTPFKDVKDLKKYYEELDLEVKNEFETFVPKLMEHIPDDLMIFSSCASRLMTIQLSLFDLVYNKAPIEEIESFIQSSLVQLNLSSEHGRSLMNRFLRVALQFY